MNDYAYTQRPTKASKWGPGKAEKSSQKGHGGYNVVKKDNTRQAQARGELAGYHRLDIT